MQTFVVLITKNCVYINSQDSHYLSWLFWYNKEVLLMLCSKNSCTGCLSCQNICPKNAIQVITDKQGVWQPQIDKEKCINCRLCHKSCPVYFKPHNEENLAEIYAC